MNKVVKFLKHYKRSLILSGVLLLLIIALGFQIYLNPQFLVQAYQKEVVLAQQIRSGELWAQKSTAKVWVDGQSLKLQFDVVDRDKPMLEQFNQNLGTNDDYLKGISVDLDPQTIQFLQQFTPITLTLKITDHQIGFKSSEIPGFASSFIKDEKQFATESGNLDLKISSNDEFQLNIQDPEPLVKYATHSGQLNLSSKLNPLFPLLERVSTIRMMVNGKSINGVLNLK